MKKTLRTAFRPIIRRQARRQVELIRDTGIAFAPPIADALEEVLAAQLSPEERSWADRIESLRSELAQNTAPVSVIDFGAGRSTDHRSAEEMSAGIANTTTVAKEVRRHAEGLAHVGARQTRGSVHQSSKCRDLYRD